MVLSLRRYSTEQGAEQMDQDYRAEGKESRYGRHTQTGFHWSIAVMAWACIRCRIWLWPEDAVCFACGEHNPTNAATDAALIKGSPERSEDMPRPVAAPTRTTWIRLPSGAIRGSFDIPKP